jgi:photosystem II stability/assembly factor-like uncharacterized protein
MSHTRFVLSKRLAFLLAGLSTLSIPCAAQTNSGSSRPSKFDVNERHQQEFLHQHTDESGEVRPELWRQGIEHAKQMKIGAGVTLATGRVVGVQWTQIGPAPLLGASDPARAYSGEVTDIAIDPRNATDRVIYIATNDGGIWKSIDGGSSWAPKTDFMPSLSMGAVALDPTNQSIVYAGTGNFFNNGFFKGVGVYRSIDAGETWTALNPGNIFTGVSINRIVVPARDVVLVATNVGLYRSVDGGVNFGTNPPLFNNGSAFFAGSFVRDLKLDTLSPSIVFAAVSGQGIYKSTDGGATFPANLFNNPNAPAAGTFTNIHFDQSTQPDNQTLYATVESVMTCSPNDLTPSLFKSTDGGSSWNQLAASGLNGGSQCGYDDEIGVDPQNAARLYIGLQALYRSVDGGASFAVVPDSVRPDPNIPVLHPDVHTIRFSPPTHFASIPNTPVYVGTDGGIATSADGGENFNNLNNGIATLLFRQIDIGRRNTENNAFTYGCMQDTALGVRRAEFPILEWHEPAAVLDGQGIAVDPSNPRNAYSTLNSGVNVTRDGGNTLQFFGVVGMFRLAVDPNNSMIVYATSGGTFAPGPNLFRSTDGGVSFALINTFPAPILSIATADIDSKTLWVGLTDGTVQRTANALAGAAATWVALTVTGAPNQAVAGVAIDPLNTDEVVVVYQGFTNPNPTTLTRHVFRTTDNGATWTDISGTVGADPRRNLPDLPLNSVVIDPGTSPHTIIVASDAAVFRTANLGATWEVLGLGLPTVDCTSLALDSSVTPSLLRVGTYGRSVFELTPATGPLLAVNADLDFGITSVGRSESRTVRLFNVGSTDLHVVSFVYSSGSMEFQIISGPATPVVISPGDEIDFTIRFSPSAPGDKTATFLINSDDPFTPARQLFASGTGR